MNRSDFEFVGDLLTGINDCRLWLSSDPGLIQDAGPIQRFPWVEAWATANTGDSVSSFGWWR